MHTRCDRDWSDAACRDVRPNNIKYGSLPQPYEASLLFVYLCLLLRQASTGPVLQRCDTTHPSDQCSGNSSRPAFVLCLILISSKLGPSLYSFLESWMGKCCNKLNISHDSGKSAQKLVSNVTDESPAKKSSWKRNVGNLNIIVWYCKLMVWDLEVIIVHFNSSCL